jgi:hypothetical protein
VGVAVLYAAKASLGDALLGAWQVHKTSDPAAKKRIAQAGLCRIQHCNTHESFTSKHTEETRRRTERVWTARVMVK